MDTIRHCATWDAIRNHSYLDTSYIISWGWRGMSFRRFLTRGVVYSVYKFSFMLDSSTFLLTFGKLHRLQRHEARLAIMGCLLDRELRIRGFRTSRGTCTVAGRTC